MSKSTDLSVSEVNHYNLDFMNCFITQNHLLLRPLGLSQNRSSFRSPLAAKYPRSAPRNHYPLSATKSLKGGTEIPGGTSKNADVKCNSSAQTDISALPHQWRSETHLIGTDYGLAYTLPSKYNSPQANSRNGKNSLR